MSYKAFVKADRPVLDCLYTSRQAAIRKCGGPVSFHILSCQWSKHGGGGGDYIKTSCSTPSSSEFVFRTGSTSTYVHVINNSVFYVLCLLHVFLDWALSALYVWFMNRPSCVLIL